MSTVEQIEDLVGGEISAVSFVADYMELHFHGPVLRALVAAILETPAGQWVFPEPGSREAMCNLIGATVAEVLVDDDQFIQIRCENGMVFTIPFEIAFRVDSEAAHFVTGRNRSIAVW
jgi:hypothetical protein